jgi:hypothetical protein
VNIANDDSLSGARAWVQSNLHTGVSCPCCGQLCKVYKRKLNATMTRALILIYHWFQAHPQKKWLHVPDFLVKVKADSTIAGGDVSKLRYWDLLEARQGERSAGFYRITDLGCKFVENKAAVPCYAYIYNQLLLRMSDDVTTIDQALGDRFDYKELMAR